MASSKHFRYLMVEAGKWSRIDGTDAVGNTNEARPHLIPTTDAGKLYLGVTPHGPSGAFCTGKVQLEDGKEALGYRFIILSETDAVPVMAQLDESVEWDMAIVD